VRKEIFKAIRLYLGLSQSEFAKKLGVSETTVCLIEKGERRVTDRVRMRLAKHFELTPEFLDYVERANKLSTF
jgi:transcriptional regulator with XRE-family HTH domain